MFRTIPNKRELLARAFARVGLLRLIEQTIVKRQPVLMVLTYHRIADPCMNQFYDPVISATVESFRKQIQWLRNSVRILALDELINQIESGLPWREPVMLLTFDDGYRDNFDLAVPILREQNTPATFFIPSSFFDRFRLPWWDHVAYVVKHTNKICFILECRSKGGFIPLEINLQTMSRSVAIMKIIHAFLHGMIADERWFLEQLTERAMVEVNSEALGHRLFMSWAHIKQLAALNSGLSIGSHTHTHRKLGGLDEDSQREELTTSKKILEAQLGRAIKALAYPYGGPGTFTPQTKVMAAQAGYYLALSSHEGINRFSNLDRYEVRRLSVGSGDSANLIRARCTLHAAFGKSFL